MELTHWWTEDSFIGSVEDGKCYFVPYSHVLDMHEWSSYDELIVPVTNVKVLLDKRILKGMTTSFSSKEMSQSLHPPASIMKGGIVKAGGKQLKSVTIERTPADALPSRYGNESEGVTTGGTMSSLEDEKESENEDEEKEKKRERERERERIKKMERS